MPDFNRWTFPPANTSLPSSLPFLAGCNVFVLHCLAGADEACSFVSFPFSLAPHKTGSQLVTLFRSCTRGLQPTFLKHRFSITWRLFSVTDATGSQTLHAGENPAAVRKPGEGTDPSLFSVQVLKAFWSCCWTRSFNLPAQLLSDREIKVSSRLYIKLWKDFLAWKSLIPRITLPYEVSESTGRPMFHPVFVVLLHRPMVIRYLPLLRCQRHDLVSHWVRHSEMKFLTAKQAAVLFSLKPLGFNSSWMPFIEPEEHCSSAGLCKNVFP